MKSNQDKKRKIAEKAIELIKDGDVVFVDASSTSMYLLKKLASKNGLTVITNGIPALQYLSNFKIKVLCTGGSLDTEDRAALVGIEAIKTLQNIRANIAFISPQAIDEAGNLFDCYPDEVEVTRQMIESSMTTVALCDSTKIGKSSTFKQCSIKNLDFLVSDISLDTVYGNMFPNTKFL